MVVEGDGVVQIADDGVVVAAIWRNATDIHPVGEQKINRTALTKIDGGE